MTCMIQVFCLRLNIRMWDAGFLQWLCIICSSKWHQSFTKSKFSRSDVVWVSLIFARLWNIPTCWKNIWWRVNSTVAVHSLAHGDVIKWKIFPRYWPFVRGFHRLPAITLTKPMTQKFDVFFDLRLNKRLRKQSRCRWFETPSPSLWRHCNDTGNIF